MRYINDFNSHIIERKHIGVLYHFTSIWSLFNMIKEDRMYSNHGSISFTRNRNLLYSISNVRISFDGDKLSDKFKIEPFIYAGGYNRDTRIDDIRNNYKNEMEERIKLPEINNIIKYILKVDILNSNIEPKNIERIKFLEENYPFIEINLINKFSR